MFKHVYFSLTAVECGALENQYKHYNLTEDGFGFYADACINGRNTLDCVNGSWLYNDTNCGRPGSWFSLKRFT